MAARSRSDDDPPAAEPPRAREPDVDDMGAQSFPASDPPAVWTWDVEPPRADRAPRSGPGPRAPGRPA